MNQLPTDEQAQELFNTLRQEIYHTRWNDSAIDTRMHVIWSVLDPDTEILESVSLPEKLPPFKL